MENTPNPADQLSPEAPPQHRLEHTRTGHTWAFVAAIVAVLVVLVVFLAQNTQSVHINFFTVSGSLPLGVALLLTAVGGGVITGLVAGLRILQLRRIARRQHQATPPSEATLS